MGSAIRMMGAFLLALSVCVGCQSKQLIFSTYTKVGLDVSATDMQPTQLVFGYKRYEGAIVPVELPKGSTDDQPKEEREAMSVYAAMEVDNQWLKGLEILQVFATGDAAVNVAKKKDAFSGLIRAIAEAEPTTPGAKKEGAK